MTTTAPRPKSPRAHLRVRSARDEGWPISMSALITGPIRRLALALRGAGLLAESRFA
jgi:hypothetical protein